MRLQLRNHRSRLTFAVLAVFSAVSVGGEGLHLIPGLGHSCSHLSVCSCFSAKHSECAPHVCHDCQSCIGEADCTHCDMDEDACPICNFFALAKSVPAVAAEVRESMVFPASGIWADSLAMDDVPSFYRSRAPPAYVL